MEFRQLTYFLAVARELNFSEASRKLDVSQPVLSRTIKKLEEEVGMGLFVREASGLTLTPEGKILVTQSNIILSQIERARSAIDDSFSGSKLLRIGFMPFSMLAFGSEFVGYLRESFSGYELQMREFYKQAAIEKALEEGEVDLIFHYPPLSSTNLVSRLIYTDEVVAYVAETHPKADQEWFTAPDLFGEKYIMPTDDTNPALMHKFRQFFKEHNQPLQIAQQTGPHQARLTLVATGMGICLDGISVQQRLKVPGVIAKRFVVEQRAYAMVSMAWHKDSVPESTDLLLNWFANRQAKQNT